MKSLKLHVHVLCVALYISTMITLVLGDSAFICPSGCRCTIGRRQQLQPADGPLGPAPGRRVNCQGGTAITRVTQAFIDILPQDTVQLDLSGNDIEEIQQGTFQTLNNLQRLNLSFNPLTVVEPGAFRGLTNLDRLDLSGTKIAVINSSWLEGLPRLQRLLLLNTSIITLYPGSFDGLPALARLDLQTSSLVCECHLEWIVDWLQSSKVRFDNQSTCGLPTALRGTSLKALIKSDLHCEYPLELPVFDLTPATSQVAFEGDKLPLECRVTEPPTGASMNVTWIHGDLEEIRTDRSRGLFVNVRVDPDRTRVTTLVVEQLDARRDTGNWTCRVTTSLGRVSERSVQIVVLSSATGSGDGKGQYCPIAVTDSNRGRYIWPRTIVGVLQDLPCVTLPDGADTRSRSGLRAQRLCDADGRWMEPDVSRCPFTSDTTRRLEEYSLVVAGNQTDRLNNLAESLKQLIGDGRSIVDKDDVILLSRVIEGLSRSVGNNEKLAQVLIELVGMVMNVSSPVLRRAHREDKVFSRLVESVEQVADQLLYGGSSTVLLNTKSIAVRAHKVDPRGFIGIRCTSLREPAEAYNDVDSVVPSSERFSCADLKADNLDEDDDTTRSTSERLQLDASITVLADYIQQARCSYPDCSHAESYRMTFVVYHNSSFFPLINDSAGHHHHVTSSTVISGKIAGVNTEGIDNTTGLYITVEMALPVGLINRVWTPVYWNSTANGGFGAWLTDGCAMVGYPSDTVVKFRCNHLSTFALLLNDEPAATALEALLISLERTGTIVYVGSAILFVCLLTVIMVYTIHRRTIMMSRKLRHSVCNLCVSALLLCITYTLGVRLCQPVIACRTIGISIHYLSLCTPLWITVIAYKLYNKLFKIRNPRQKLSDDLGPDEPQKPKPVMTSYLLGWGIAVIVCGISGAINWINYATENFCFLTMEPAFLTLFVPAGIIIVINVLLFLRICCLLGFSSSHHENVSRCDDPDTDETHDNNEIEVLAPRRNPSSQCPHGTRSSRSNSISSDQASSILDPVYKPSRQLYAVVTSLALFCITWFAGVCVVSPPFTFLYCDVVYQCFYAVSSASFGIFAIVYYCIGRPEVRALSCYCCRRRRRQSVSSRVETNKFQKGSTNGSVVHNDDRGQVVEHVVIVHSSHLAESSVASVADLVSLAAKSVCSECDHSQKMSQCPIPSLSATTSIAPPMAPAAPIPDYAIFYNQRQNGVARKYWERTKKKRAAAQRLHVPPHELGLELTSNGECARLNGEVQRRPLLEHDTSVNYQTTVVENHGKRSQNSRDGAEEQPLLHIPTPMMSETQCDVDCVVVKSSLKSQHNGPVQLNNSGDDGAETAETLRDEQFTSNGHLLTETTNGSACGKKAPVENKVDCFIEQLEMRIPAVKPKKLSSLSSDQYRDADQNGMPADCSFASKSTREKLKPESDMGVSVGDQHTLAAYAFINKNYSTTSPSAHRTDFDSSFMNRTDFDSSFMKGEVAESVQTRRSSLSDLSSSDIWIMQDASGAKSKNETSV